MIANADFWSVGGAKFSPYSQQCSTRIRVGYDDLKLVINLNDGLELIDYKSTKEVKLPSADEIDLQIGLYYLALEQRYRQSLRKLSLIYLRMGEKVSFDASSNHKQRVADVIGELAIAVADGL